jgi:2,4-dienoyl-CoA reductase-like NADH-dependent reductase (Old Yellow Enzyme family)
VIAEATAVSPEGRITPGDLGIWKDEHILPLQNIAAFISQQGAIPGIQLAHAGRKASRTEPWNGSKEITISEGGWVTVAPSVIPFIENENIPVELDLEGISKVVSGFTDATKRAVTAGFKLVEIHAAHGYLINEFMSPLSNTRTDQYGGVFENRIRLLMEVTAAVRNELPDEFPLLVRISASDWKEGGWTIEDSVALANILKHSGVELIDCSSGGLVPDAKIPAAPGYQVPFAEIIRKETGICTGAVGIIVTPKQADEIIQTGKADIVLIARELLRDPYFPLRAASELKADITWPVQYERAKR